jgi:hypothetical protein
MLIGSRTSGGLVAVRVLSGGTGYVSPPSVVISGGGGTGASGVAVMAGTVVQSIIVTAQGTGYTANPTVALTAATGSGAAATAYAHTAPLRPMSFFKGRFGDVYGVDGSGRGVRWEGGTAQVQPIGLHKPAVGPAVTAATTQAGKRVTAIQLVDSGAGYASAPTVSFTGGTPDRGAEAEAIINNGRVTGVVIRDSGAGYQSTPSVVFTGGIGTGAVLALTASGRVSGVRIIDSGEGHTSSGTLASVVTAITSNGLTGFNARVIVDNDGQVTQVVVLSSGTGATTTPTLGLVGMTDPPDPTTFQAAVIEADVVYSVATIGVSTGGAGYFTPPFITITPDVEDNFGRGAAATCSVNSDGAVSAVTVTAAGQYLRPPTAVIRDTSAKAQATLSPPLRGTYQCAIRYIDGSDQLDPNKQRSAKPSSISELKEVKTEAGASGLTWAFSHPYIDDRVVAMELWRTTREQSVLLFRVATIKRTDPEWDATYFDTLPDDELSDPKRTGYGLMPITLPSGQINARRFEVPPSHLTIGVMFQDRAWYAGDSVGGPSNSLYYSEVDEPESVPLANELVVQENTDTPDFIVALVPLGSALLIVQRAHVYRLMYVAQPVIDASILLTAYRGVLNNRCWATMAGVAFLVDSIGMYAFDGNQEQSVSLAVDNYWRDGLIDFSKADKFHVSADYSTRTVRFYYCRPGDTEPTRALCYCTATEAWWEEVYPQAVTATVSSLLGGQTRPITGHADGAWRKFAGTKDGGDPISYEVRTGNFAFNDEPERTLEIVYSPTADDSNLALGLHYNNSATARPNAIVADRGSGWTVTPGGPAVINMKKTRSPLGDATGYAHAIFAGRKNDRSAGGDRHVAANLSGQQTDNPVVIHAVRVQGSG